jgi:hypothetical protein
MRRMPCDTTDRDTAAGGKHYCLRWRAVFGRVEIFHDALAVQP